MRQFSFYAIKGVALGGAIGGIGVLALAKGDPANAIMGAFVGALLGAFIGMRARTQSLQHKRKANPHHHLHYPHGVYMHGSSDLSPGADIGGFDAGGFDGGGFDGGSG